MTDEQEGLVVLFPENFPDWALTLEERHAKRRFRLIEGADEEPEEPRSRDDE